MAKQSDVDLLLARAQVWIVVVFSVGFFAVLFFLMVYHENMTNTEVTILTGLLSSLATIIALQQNFMFARTRPAALPDPSTTTSTTTTTTGPSPTVIPPGTTVITPPLPAVVTAPAPLAPKEI
jgi:hypothetical protein